MNFIRVKRGDGAIADIRWDHISMLIHGETKAGKKTLAIQLLNNTTIPLDESETAAGIVQRLHDAKGTRVHIHTSDGPVNFDPPPEPA